MVDSFFVLNQKFGNINKEVLKGLHNFKILRVFRHVQVVVPKNTLL